MINNNSDNNDKYTGGHGLMAPVKVNLYAINTEKKLLKTKCFFATLRWHKGGSVTHISMY